MATTAAELIAFLQTLPPETEVSVLRAYTSGDCATTGFTALDLTEHCDVLDTRGKLTSPWKGDVYLRIGLRG